MSDSKTGRRAGMVAAGLAMVVFAAAALLFLLGSRSSEAAKASTRPEPSRSVTSLSLPLFFEPNQGQTNPQVKFLARGAGYGLFLTADEAVLSLQHSGAKGQPSSTNVIRMRLDGANSSARVHGTQLLPGKSNYFIGNDPSKWRRDIPQFARVEYRGVYPGIDLDYYGNQQQLEYDFRVAPGAEPSQIALTFQGASAHLDSGDLVLSTTGGDVRFHAPHIYQPGEGRDKVIAGSFRQLAENKIGFTVGPYDHSRELVIDPLLSYSTFIGGTGAESLVKVAVDAANLIYVAGSTTSSDFPTLNPIQGLTGSQNIFIAKLDPSQVGGNQLLFGTYLGSSGQDSLAGIAVDANNGAPNIYVAGTTTSTASDFPVTASTAFQSAPEEAGIHGFLTKLSPASPGYTLSYSTYISGNGSDTVTGLAIDTLQDAYLTGVTTSTDDQSKGFPANPNGFQRQSNAGPGLPQFFASEINTTGSGSQSMVYSTYFGGGNFGPSNPPVASVFGGGIAVDASGNIYFTGTTNMLPQTGGNGEIAYPLFNAYQRCLNNNCATPDPSHTDAILVKINPSPRQPQAPPLLSTYLGGTQDEFGIAVAVDTSSNAYVTGSTDSQTTGSADWNCIPQACILGSQSTNGGGRDAFVAKITNQVQSGSIFPLSFFTFIGGSALDSGQAIIVDSVGTAHVAGTTSSFNLPVLNPLGPTPYNGAVYGSGVNGSNAFVALIATGTVTSGNYVTYLGGDQTDAGTGIALDFNNTAYVAGSTNSSNFPTQNPYNAALNGTDGGASDAFVAKLGASSGVKITSATANPSPVPAGTAAVFTFSITNTGPDPAANVQFQATVPTSGIGSVPTATANSGGTCSPALGALISCQLGSLAVNGVASVQVSVTPSIPVNPQNPNITVTGVSAANGGGFPPTSTPVTDGIVDFAIAAANSGQTVKAGDLASFPIVLIPEPTYNANITMSQSSSPAIVTATTPTFTNPTVTLSGTAQGTTTLNIQTVARPVNTGSLLRRSFYATWLPIGGLSLVGLGIGAGSRRRRWLVGAILGLIIGMIMLLPSCSSSSTPATSPGGTSAGQYTITITGSSSGSAAHNTIVTLNVT